MTAVQITSMKDFMNKLLLSDTFDCFLLEEAVVRTASTFTIDGHINKEFFSGENTEITFLNEASANKEPPTSGRDFRPWSEMKGLCFDLIKGKRTPLFFRFVLQLMPEKAAALLERENCDVDSSQIKALVLNIRYDGTKAVLTTGISFHTFVMSKEPDIIWDKALLKYLDGNGIEYSN